MMDKHCCQIINTSKSMILELIESNENSTSNKRENKNQNQRNNRRQQRQQEINASNSDVSSN